ncbi:MAG: PDZ domain-containing protein [Acidobacteriota bacterium]
MSRAPRSAVLCAVLALGSRAAVAADPTADPLRLDIERARQVVYPALVNINVVVRRFMDGRAERSPGAGSGVIVDDKGRVLTNFHVGGHTTRITCTLPSGESLDASVIAHDPLTDLSVLELDLAGRTQPIPHAVLGDSDALDVGEPVLAMGNPLTLASSMTLGIVSNPRRVFTDFMGTRLVELDLGEGEMTGLLTRWIQHDALILPGNSGGPLVNLKGEVVGINELGGGGVGFAIPSNLARSVLDRVVATGAITRGWIGFAIHPTAKIGLEGALVAWVSPGSSAEKAGLEAGDLLHAVDGAPVSCRFFEEVPLVYQTVAQKTPGTKVTLDVERAGQKKTLTATVESMEPVLGEEEEIRSVGATVRAITGPMALARRLPTREGVLVTGVRPGFPFEEAKPSLGRDDIVLTFGGKATPSLDALTRAVADAKGSTTVTFMRGDESLVTVVNVAKDEDRRPGGGELPRAFLGVKTQVLTPSIAKALGLGNTKGFRVTQVFEETAAARAGLLAGDVITAIGERPLEASRPQDAQDLKRAIEAMSIGEKARLHVLRGGTPREIDVALDPTPPSTSDLDQKRQDLLELTVRDISLMDRIENRLDAKDHGVLAIEVTNGSWAQVGGLQAGDLILQIDGKPVPSVDAFTRIVEPLLATKPKVITVFVKRAWRTRFVFIEPDWTGESSATAAAKK